MKKFKIYCLKNPDTMKIRYIGVTTAKYTSSRLSQHWYSATHNYQTHVAKWIRKIGKRPIIETIEICNEDNWEEREQYWIDYYDNLTNIHKGGKGVVINRNKDSIQRSAESHHIKVVQLNDNGDFINKFNSVKEATEFFKGKSHSAISNVLHNRYGAKRAYGYQWFYYDDYIKGNYQIRKNAMPFDINPKYTIYVYNKDFDLLESFSSKSAASRYIGCATSGIHGVLNTNKTIYNKFYIRDYKI